MRRDSILIVSIVSALAAGGLLVAAIVSERHTKRATDATVTAANATTVAAGAAERALEIERVRLRREMAPRYRVTREAANPGNERLRLVVELTGPPELESLGELIVTIRDDRPNWAETRPIVGGPSAEEIAAQVWGRPSACLGSPASRRTVALGPARRSTEGYMPSSSGRQRRSRADQLAKELHRAVAEISKEAARKPAAKESPSGRATDPRLGWPRRLDHHPPQRGPPRAD